MTKLPLLLAITLSSSVMAQDTVWEKVDQRTESVVYHGAFPLGNGRWLVKALANPAGGVPAPMHFIKAINADGTLAWEQPLVHDVFEVGDVHPYPDGGVVAGGPKDYCDVWDSVHVSRYDHEGDLLWEFTLPYAHTTRIAVNGQGLIAVVSEMISILDPEGTVLYDNPSPLEYFTQAVFQNDSTLLLAGYNTLHQIDLHGAPVSPPLSIDVSTHGLRVTPGFILLLQYNELLVLDHQLVQVAQHDLSMIAPVKGFVEGGDGLHLFNPAGVYAFDPITGHTLMDGFESISGHTITAAGLDNGSLLTFGNQVIEGRGSAAVRSRPMTELLEFDEDVEILVFIDSIWVEPFNSYFKEKADLRAQIINHGNDTVRSLALSHRTLEHPWLCGPNATTAFLEPPGIAPGETTIIPMMDVLIKYTFTYNYPVAPVSREICLAALAPNDKLDRHPDNNYSCASITLTYPVGLQEISPVPFRVHPNPFVDQVTIDLAGHSPVIRDLEIRDASGRLVLKKELPGRQERHQLDLSGLNAEVFILSIRDEQRSSHTKILKNQ